MNYCLFLGLRTLCIATADISKEFYDDWKHTYYKASTSIQGREKKLEEAAELIETVRHNTRDWTKPIPSTQSIEYRVNFKVLVLPKNLIPIPCTIQYYFDTFSDTLHPHVLQ